MTETYTGELRWQHGDTIYCLGRISGGWGITTEAGQPLYTSTSREDAMAKARSAYGLDD